MRIPFSQLEISRSPLGLYGSLQPAIEAIREHRPLDLSAQIWRRANPHGTFREWQSQARRCLLEGLHYNPGPLDLDPEILEVKEEPDFIVERISFNTTPWFRVNGFFLLPKGVEYPVPGLLVFHAWGGPMIFGKERVVNTGRDHPLLIEHRERCYSGNYLAEEFVKAGYAVLVIDAYHFGERSPRGLRGIPPEYDPFLLSKEEAMDMNRRLRDLLYLGVRQLNWAGTTWMGVNYWDDSRAIDYLLSREEVDPERIGCTGLSGGGWRTNMLVALEPRIKAAVSVGWMTTGDYQQIYNVEGAIGTFCLLPGVWDRLDVPDLIVMGAPKAAMVVTGSQDPLFPQEAQKEAERQILEGYEWAGAQGNAYYSNPYKVHCYDEEIQREAIDWFDRHLKNM
jgi:dienelactone hydrolase